MNAAIDVRTIPVLDPIAPEEYRARMERLRGLMRENGLDGLVLSDHVPGQVQMYSWQPNSAYVRYLSGFHLPEVTGPYAGILVVPLSGDPSLVVPPGALRSFQLLAERMTWIGQVVTSYQEDPAWEERTWWGLITDQGADVAKALRASGLVSGRVGVAGSWKGIEETKSALPDVEFVSTLVDGGDDSLRSHTGGKRDILQHLISDASPAEVERLELAHAASDAALTAYIGAAKAGATQREALVEGKVAGIRAGAEDVWFIGTVDVKPFIFWDLSLVGPTDRFKEGELYFAEIAQATVEGYKIQTVRSFVVGAPSPSQVRLMQTLKGAVETMIETARPGITGGEIWELGIKLTADAGYEPWVVFGHSEGFKPHPRPIAFGPGNRDFLEVGQVVNLHVSMRDTINDHIGMTGDTYLMESGGLRPLTTVPIPLDAL